MIDVEKVILDSAHHFIGRVCFATEAVHLCPAGDAGQHPVASEISVYHHCVFFVMDNCMRPWPDEGHGADDDIEELRQLIQTVPSQKASDRGHPRIATPGLRYRWIGLAVH